MTRSVERIAASAFRRWLEPDNRLTRLLIRHTARVHRGAFVATVVLFPVVLIPAWSISAGRRMLGRKPRVVWGPTPILTIAESSALLQRLGYPSTTVVFATYHIRSEFDINMERAIANPAVNYWLPNLVFLWSLLRFDVFHFFYDGGLWSGMKIVPMARWLELPLLRLAGKRVIASAYGADVRMRHLNEMWQPYNICAECPAPGVYCVCDASGLTRTKYYRDWCNVVLAMGDMRDFVFDSRTNVNYWPVDVQAIECVGTEPHDGPIRIVHSPNHPHFKGTRFIESAVAGLRERGFNVTLDLVQGVSNREARRRYAEADIVFAQCIAGWIGYTELEAMAAGKPVITYIRNDEYLTTDRELPFVSATPATLEQELEKLVVDQARRQDLGRRGRAYVEDEWSYEALMPVYDALHREVWRDNRLGRTISAKWKDFRHGETGYRVGREITSSTLGEWTVYSDPQLNMRRIEGGIYGQPPFTGEGIPRVWYGGRYVEHVGAVALFALNAFHLSLVDPNPVHQQRFLAAAEWLRDALVVDESGVGRWEYRFEAVGRDLEVPWVSCFSQSLGMSILLRAEQLRPGAGYGAAAGAAAELFRVSVPDRGILWEEGELTFLEEYPEFEPAHVLNGFVTGMFGLHEFYRVRGEPWAKELFDRCCLTLRRTLPDYETPNGLRYDLKDEAVVSPDYYYFIVQQLLALHRLTGDRFFYRFAKRWSRRLYRSKVRAFVHLREPI